MPCSACAKRRQRRNSSVQPLPAKDEREKQDDKSAQNQGRQVRDRLRFTGR